MLNDALPQIVAAKITTHISFLINKLIVFLSCLFISINICYAEFIYPEYENVYVNDYADLLDTETETRLRNYLEEAV